MTYTRVQAVLVAGYARGTRYEVSDIYTRVQVALVAGYACGTRYAVSDIYKSASCLSSWLRVRYAVRSE